MNKSHPKEKFEEFKEREIEFGAKEFLGGLILGVFIGFILALWLLK